MYTGPIKQRPSFPMDMDNWDKPEPCTRADGLANRDRMRQFDAENKRCCKRRNKPGFEKIDDMRYQGGK